MKRLIYFLVFLALSIVLLFGYIRFNERVTFQITNSFDSDISWQWACNSTANGKQLIVHPNEKIVKTVFPLCEGKLGIIITKGNETYYEMLFGYVPVGKPLVIDIVIITNKQIKFAVTR